MRKPILFIFSIVLSIFSVTAQTHNLSELRTQLTNYVNPYKATIGIALQNITSSDTLSIGNSFKYPTQSVYKFPLALAVLAEVDKGHLSLSQKIFIPKKELHKTWSPLRDKYPKGNIRLSLAELLMYSVSLSDNNACDILFKLIGGPAKVQHYMHEAGFKHMAIAATEVEMHKAWKVMYTNWSEPFEMVRVLEKFYKHQLVSDTSTSFLMKLMIESSNSANRIKGNLPASYQVAHKTGSSGSNRKGLSGATNDIGIITLPNGNVIALVVFVCNSTEEFEVNEKIIADISEICCNYFSR